MTYAKVNGDVCLKYPYGWEDLHKENENTRYDARYSLPQWYSLTEEAADTENEIVEVIVKHNLPTIDKRTQKLVMSDYPSLENGEWVLKYVILEKTEEEIIKFDSFPNANL